MRYVMLAVLVVAGCGSQVEQLEGATAQAEHGTPPGSCVYAAGATFMDPPPAPGDRCVDRCGSPEWCSAPMADDMTFDCLKGRCVATARVGAAQWVDRGAGWVAAAP